MSELPSTIETAEESVRAIEGWLDEIDDLSDADQERVDSMLEHLEKLETVLEEAEDVLEATDFSELPEAIDEEKILEAIEVGKIPDAIEQHDAKEVVNLRRLIEAINLRELWDVGNVREIWGETKELSDAVNDLVGGDEEAGEDGLLDGDDSETGDGLLEDVAEEGEALVGKGKDVAEEGEALVGKGKDVAGDSLDDLGDDGFGLGGGDAEAYQFLIQQQALEGLDELRDALLIAHEKFENLYEYNRKRTRQIDRETNSRNPTAVSTITTERPDLRNNARYSTIPRQVQYSSAPGHTRIYGDRFEHEREKRRGENDD